MIGDRVQRECFVYHETLGDCDGSARAQICSLSLLHGVLYPGRPAGQLVSLLLYPSSGWSLGPQSFVKDVRGRAIFTIVEGHADDDGPLPYDKYMCKIE